MRRRGIVAAMAAAVGGFGLLTGCGGKSEAADAKPSPGGHGSGSPSKSPSPQPKPKPKPKPELPRGGRTLFPEHRLFGYCGYPGAVALGRLGTGDPEQRAKEIEAKAPQYADGRKVLPVFELLATIVNSTPGPDGLYRTRTSHDTIQQFHDLARRHKALLLLNIQPGRADLLGEVKALEEWLVHPDVGVALDPEWEMSAGQVPGNVYGRTSGQELSSVAEYLSGIVKEHDLPEKAMVFHQVAPLILNDQDAIRPAEGVQIIKSADGLGSPGLKRATWGQLVHDLPKDIHMGFKLFFDEDTRGGSALMTPKEVLGLKPEPEYVMYE